jgi:hypothetical protein
MQWVVKSFIQTWAWTIYCVTRAAAIWNITIKSSLSITNYWPPSGPAQVGGPPRNRQLFVCCDRVDVDVLFLYWRTVRSTSTLPMRIATKWLLLLNVRFRRLVDLPVGIAQFRFMAFWWPSIALPMILPRANCVSLLFLRLPAKTIPRLECLPFSLG